LLYSVYLAIALRFTWFVMAEKASIGFLWRLPLLCALCEEYAVSMGHSRRIIRSRISMKKRAAPWSDSALIKAAFFFDYVTANARRCVKASGPVNKDRSHFKRQWLENKNISSKPLGILILTRVC